MATSRNPRPWKDQDKARGERLRELRREAGLTQLEVAQRLGMANERSVQTWEHGGPFKTLQNVRRLASVLGTSDDLILTGETAPEPVSQVDRLEQRVHAMELVAMNERRLMAIEAELAGVRRCLSALAAAVSALVASSDGIRQREPHQPEASGS